jgi:hypothetical protein
VATLKSVRSGQHIPTWRTRRLRSSLRVSQHFTISRHASARGGFLFHALPFFEIAFMPVYLDPFAIGIVNGDHSIM